MPANENNHRAQGALLQGEREVNDDRVQDTLLQKTEKHVVGAGNAREEHQGHHALRKGRASIANGVYLITTTTFERQKLFDDFPVGCAVARCFEDADFLGDAAMLAWVLMPDHVHWLLQLGERDGLGRVVNRLKSASARYANRARGASGVVWAKAFHDHGLRSARICKLWRVMWLPIPCVPALCHKLEIIHSGMRCGCRSVPCTRFACKPIACRARSYIRHPRENE